MGTTKNNGTLINRLINKLRSWEVLFKFSDWLYTIFRTTKDFSVAFKNLFFNKEIGELFGLRNGNFYKIVLLYIILFLSVGFGIQSKKFFNKQLDNPFVRYIPISISGDASLYTSDLIDSLKTRYMQPDIKKKIRLDDIKSYSANNALRFSSPYIENDFTGIAVDYDSDLLNDAVFNKENNVIGQAYTSVEQRSIIVTLNLLKDLYLVDNDLTFEEVTPEDIPGVIMFQPGGYSFDVPLTIQAVAEQLPWENDFILPSKFNDHLFASVSRVIADESDEQVSFYINKQVADFKKLNDVISEFATLESVSTDSSNLVLQNTGSINNLVLVAFSSVTNSYSFDKALKEKLKSEFELTDEDFIDAYFKKYNQTGKNYTALAQQSGIFVVFESLRKVKDFNDDLKEYSSGVITHLLTMGSKRKLKGLELEMSSINLRLILNVIEIIVVAFLIIIGMLAITALFSFVRVLFEMYFQKIEKNIGTFMAFGINIKVVYIVMLIVFSITSIFISLLIAFILGELLEIGIVCILGSALGDEVQLFSLLNGITVLAVIAVALANWFAFRKAAKIFSQWPGDIINDRWR